MKKLLFLLLFFLLLGCSNESQKETLAFNDADINPDNGSIDSSENAEDDFVNDQDSSHKNEEDLKDKYEENDLSTDESSDSDFQPEPIAFGAHFAEIDRVKYTLDGITVESGKARIFYTFQPADKNPEEAPIFVFFNGGPGLPATTLFTFNTSRMTVDPNFTGDEDVIRNPYSFTKIANIIHVDARETGFSYGVGEEECSQNSFNLFIDAADFIRVILDTFSRFPELKDNPVYLTGESYGGKRATMMLNMILFYRKYLEGSERYIDPDLFRALDNHFNEIFPDSKGNIGPDVVAEQFAGQVLIQPLIQQGQVYFADEILQYPDSPLFELGEEVGIPYDPDGKNRTPLEFVLSVGRDIYAFHKPKGYVADMSSIGVEKITKVKTIEKLLATNPVNVKLMKAKDRSEGYRCYQISNPQNEDLSTIFGELKDNDAYYRPFFSLDLNSAAQDYISSWDYYTGEEYFLQNIRHVKTLITNAAKDIVIYSPAIPEFLKEYSKVVKDIEVDSDQFNVIYKDGEKVTVTFPVYPESGHCVPMFEPEKFLNDVAEWLEK